MSAGPYKALDMALHMVVKWSAPNWMKFMIVAAVGAMLILFVE